MIIDVPKVPEGHSVQSQDIGTLDGEHPPLSGKIACVADINRSGASLYIVLSFRGAVTLECSRCLTEFDFPFQGETRLVIQEDRSRTGPELDENSAVFYYSNRQSEVDLGSVLYDEIMVALPMKPLCKEACEGIVISIKDFSFEEQCESSKPTDPRWEALKKLKDKK
ncbi:MAG: DUF177 domain-containing protein [Chitinispirillaceae bacterium]|jgi:uncharacterized protein|nr:DUF177 domain-containing protein [Chitinispirillaceae bacterium]